MMSVTQPSRRSFLAALAAAAAVPGLASAAPAQAKPRRLKLGVASYSLRKFGLDEALAMCRELDVRHITLKDVHLSREIPLSEVEAGRRKVEAAGIEIMGGGVIYMKPDAAQIRRDFEYARAAGFPLIVGAPEPDALDLVEAMVKEFGIGLAIHNHGPEDRFYPAPQDAYRMIRDRDRRLGICIDIGHTARAGRDIVQSVHDCRDRLLDLHVKDLRVPSEKDSQVEVGKGALDIPGLFRALTEVGFSAHVALEYEINADAPLVGMKESFAYMRGVLDGLG